MTCTDAVMLCVGARRALYCDSIELPAVCGLRWQNVGEEHLSQFPEVEKLISATAKSHVEIRAVFLQSSLLKILCVLYYTGEQKVDAVVSLFVFYCKQN